MYIPYIIRAKLLIAAIAVLLPRSITVDSVKRVIREYNISNGTKLSVSNGATRIVIIASDFVIKFNYGDRVSRFGGNNSEVKLYAKAKTDGFSYLFAEPTMVVERGIQYCVMPKIDEIGREDRDVEDFLTTRELDWLRTNKVHDLHPWNVGYVGKKPVIIDYACNDYRFDSEPARTTASNKAAVRDGNKLLKFLKQLNENIDAAAEQRAELQKGKALSLRNSAMARFLKRHQSPFARRQTHSKSVLHF